MPYDYLDAFLTFLEVQVVKPNSEEASSDAAKEQDSASEVGKEAVSEVKEEQM